MSSEMSSDFAGVRSFEASNPGVLPAAPPSWQGAPLPELYRKSREALAECEKIDECAEWTRRMDAYRSYFRQANDLTLCHLAARIRLRAIRRCGEIFIESRTTTSFAEMRRQSGMALSQANSARRIAKIDEGKFDALVEQTPPASMNRLLEEASEKERESWTERAKVAEKVMSSIYQIRDVTHTELRSSGKRVFSGYCTAKDVARGIVELPHIYQDYPERCLDDVGSAIILLKDIQRELSSVLEK